MFLHSLKPFIKCWGRDLNPHEYCYPWDFKSHASADSATPAGWWSKKLFKQVKTEPTGLEPATSCVTGRCSNQLNYGSSNSFILIFTLSKELPSSYTIPVRVASWYLPPKHRNRHLLTAFTDSFVAFEKRKKSCCSSGTSSLRSMRLWNNFIAAWPPRSRNWVNCVTIRKTPLFESKQIDATAICCHLSGV